MAHVDAYLDDRRKLVLDEIRAMVPPDTRHTGGLYELMLDYPLRYGKSLRPALSIAVCCAMGGSEAAILPTAAVLELYHNAFLIHDDVEDRSYLRRSEATLSRRHGVAAAMNVGDGMLALTMRPLLDNMESIGLGKTLKILRTVSRMARESAEGQMIELRWIESGEWDQVDADYSRVVHKKTGWYSFIAPVMLGAIVAGAADGDVARFGRIFIPLGIAFQIRDDILNLVSDEGAYGKDLWGDLWEGKHTLILIHALRAAQPRDRREALRILRKAQPATMPVPAESGAPVIVMDVETKTAMEVVFLRDLIEKCDSVTYAQNVAKRYAIRFRRELERGMAEWPASSHRDFLAGVADFTISRLI